MSDERPEEGEGGPTRSWIQSQTRASAMMPAAGGDRKGSGLIRTDLGMATVCSTRSCGTAEDRFAIVGDVHGDAVRLARMLESVLDDHRRVVLVGDYVNRGANSKAVLSLLVQTKRRLRDNLILLAGNHDIATLKYIDEGSLPSFAGRGGMATIRSYVGAATGDLHRQFRRRFPPDHEHLLREQLEVCFESEDLLVSHTGYDPEAPHDRSCAALVNTPHPELLSDPEARLRAPRPTVVFGHYVQTSRRPWHQGPLVCLDTGCGTINGPLTALLLPENSFVSV